MAKVKIVQYGNPVLEQRSENVEDITSIEVKNLVDRMFQAIHDHGDGAAGLSAPQIGVLKRVAICKRVDLEAEYRKKNKKGEDKDLWVIMINPEIKTQSKELSTRWEGCLSINFGDLFGKVTRPKEVEVEYFDLDGNKHSLRATEYFAHVVQHEMDHLNGVLFLKYINNPEELYTSDELENAD